MASDHFTNLRQHRSDVDAWEPRGWWQRVADDQKALSLTSIAAVALVLYGATRRRSDAGMWWLVSGAVVGCAAASLGAGLWPRDTRFGSEPSPANQDGRRCHSDFRRFAAGCAGVHRPVATDGGFCTDSGAESG